MISFLPNPMIIPVGLAIGVLVAAPVGPVNILCIQRAVARGVWGGIAAGFGAVLGDGLIALLAAMGVGAISGLVDHYRLAIQAIGGIVLVLFGWRLYMTEPNFVAPTENGNGNGGRLQKADLKAFAWDIPKTFFLTITNPGAVLGLFAIFGGISTFVEVNGPGDALLMVAAIMCGSLLWWVGLSSLVARLRHKLSKGSLQQINRVAGLLLVVFGTVLIVEMGYELMVHG